MVWLALFYAGLDVGVGGVDEGGESGGVGEVSGLELDVPHGFAGTLEEVVGVGEGCSLEEADVDVRGEAVDVGEGDVAEADGGTAVMEELEDLVAAGAHDVEPVARDRAEVSVMLGEPSGDGGIVGDGSVEAEEVWVHGWSDGFAWE